jgi:S1-C subfamily serine protease
VGTLFSGGAHCCTDTLIATETSPDHWEAVETGALDGDGFALEDIDGDGAAELVSVDNSFLYAFDSYASSFAPIRIQRLVRGRLEDVTRDPIFIHRLRQELAGMEYLARQNPDLWHSNGFLAGWVADKARLGELADAWTKMIPFYDHSSTFGEMICTTGDTVANCPQADVRMLPFPEGLAKHLVDNGYGPIPSDLAEVDPSIFLPSTNAPQPAPPDQTSVAVQPNQAPPEPNRAAAQDISQGTGFYVAVDRLLTNAHVVEGCSEVTVTSGGVTAKGAIVSRDPTNDLAIIKVGTPSASVAKLRTGLRLGENVSAFGFPLNGLLASSGNFTRGNVTAVAGLGDDTRYVQISDPVQPGNSGGPLLDEGANVVGIVSAKLNALRVAAITNDVAQNVNFAIKAATIEGFLDANGVQYQTGELGAPLAPADIAQAAAGFSGLVYCH